MSKVRIMAQGEDGTLFCVENNIPEYRIEETFKKAEDQYPCAQLWTEEEKTSHQMYNTSDDLQMSGEYDDW